MSEPAPTPPATVRESIRAMAGYVPGEQPRDGEIVKLNTNENPYPPSPLVFEAVRAALTGDRLRKYPDPGGKSFRLAAGKSLGIDPESIVIGNGSDDVLTILTRTFVSQGGRIAAPTPSYILYRSLAEIQGARFSAIPFDADWQLPAVWPISDAHLGFLPNPNSPSGTVVSHGLIRSIADSLSGPLILDEAYGDFAAENGLSLAGRRIVVTRSLSKSYALAGIRFGFAVADPAVVYEMNKVRDSYNCDALSLAAATAAMEDQDWLRTNRAKIVATRERMATELTNLGFVVTPSQANFVWCRRTDRPHKPIYEALKDRNILVRYMDYPIYGSGLRISVGTEPEVDLLLGALREVLT